MPLASATAYPLQWPLGQPRARSRQPARFDTSLGSARDGLMDELRLMRAQHVVLSSNLRLRQDGLPLANQKQPPDPGVAVYFAWRGRSYALACDCWTRVQDNVQAVRKTVEALRGIERWGASEMVDAAFSGFLALPAPGQAAGRKWWEVLGVERTARPEDVQRAYRRRAMETHPDRGGSPEAFREVEEARRQAEAARAVTA